MAAEQLCFFKFSRPLVERFGKDFFKAVPRGPGVYLFKGEQERALYVGHSRNLRDRLAYYKNAQPEREPRRIVRLVHQVRDIELELCDSLERAQLRELALIGQLRPKFNVANTLSPTYSYFAFRDGDESGRFELHLRMNQMRGSGEVLVGGFRNRGLCSRALISLARTYFARESSVNSIYDFPARLNGRTSRWSFNGECRDPIWCLVNGDPGLLLEQIAEMVEQTSDPFLRQLLEGDFLALAEFSELAQEMAELRANREVALLSQEALQVSGHLRKRVPSPPHFHASPEELGVLV